jgi:hypothetical protein
LEGGLTVKLIYFFLLYKKLNHALSLKLIQSPTAVPPSFWVILWSTVGQANTESLKRRPSIANPTVCPSLLFCHYLQFN